MFPCLTRDLVDWKATKSYNLAKNNPDSQNIFEYNVLDTFYPQRPTSLENICFYDFVANYEFQGVDTAGQRVYKN